MPKCAAWALGVGVLLSACLNPMPDDFPSDQGADRPPGNFGGAAGASVAEGPVGSAGASGGYAGGGGSNGRPVPSEDGAGTADAGVPDAGAPSGTLPADAGADAAVDAGSEAP